MRRQGLHGRRAARAFSLVELITVVAVAALLIGLMLPALGQVRENVNRVLSSSNLRQIGLAITMHDRDVGRLPRSIELEEGRFQNLMIAYRGLPGNDLDDGDGWDGLGRLFRWQYLSAAEVFYSPSYTGEHRYERYAGKWRRGGNPLGDRIFTNYHYGGHIDWDQAVRGVVKARPNDLSMGSRLVLATDGLRSQADFSHKVGMNILRGDGSVRWRDDDGFILAALPLLPPEDDESAADVFLTVIQLIQDRNDED